MPFMSNLSSATSEPILLTPSELGLVPGERLEVSTRGRINDALAEYGSILFRGYDLATDQDFDNFIKSFDLENFPYDDSFSNAVRRNRSARVFTANEAPPDVEIHLHHEMAQALTFPTKLFFFCETAPTEGGATPICRSDIALEKLTASNACFVESLKRKGVRYRNTMPATEDHASGQGRTWYQTLSVDSAQAAEQKLTALGYRYRWLPEEELSVQTPRLPAICSFNGSPEVFFNQLVAAAAGWRDTADEAEARLVYGDDSLIDPTNLKLMIDVCYDSVVDLDWQQGDVALVDNLKVMHGRRPYRGKRSVLAALCSPMSRQAMEPTTA